MHRTLGEDVHVPQWSPEECLSKHAAGAIIVDVREDHEREQAYIQGSMHLPLSRFVEQMDGLPSEGTLIFQCAHGVRSQQAAAFMLQHGRGDVANLRGGLVAWADAGLPLQ